MRAAIPTVTALLLLAVAAPLAWTGATPISNACTGVLAGAEEGGTQDSSTSFWPPSVDCAVTQPDGAIVESTYVTWFELSLALLFGACAHLVAAVFVGAVGPGPALERLGVLGFSFSS